MFIIYTDTEIFTTFIINVYIFINIQVRPLQPGLSANYLYLFVETRTIALLSTISLC